MVITPDMHRVHHSVIVNEQNHNFGFNFTWWDRLFGTYQSQPEFGHRAMTIGTERFREERELRLDKKDAEPEVNRAGTIGPGLAAR